VVDDIDDVEAIERAIDLAIGRRHDPDPSEYLLADVLRNGRFSARRSQKRRRRLGQRYASAQPRMVTGRRRFPGDFVACDSPAASAEATELEAALTQEARASGAHGPTILAALRAGEPVSEAADEAGVSRATANRTVGRLRDRILNCGYRTAA